MDSGMKCYSLFSLLSVWINLTGKGERSAQNLSRMASCLLAFKCEEKKIPNYFYEYFNKMKHCWFNFTYIATSFHVLSGSATLFWNRSFWKLCAWTTPCLLKMSHNMWVTSVLSLHPTCQMSCHMWCLIHLVCHYVTLFFFSNCTYC